jgi:hypothetical protein
VNRPDFRAHKNGAVFFNGRYQEVDEKAFVRRKNHGLPQMGRILTDE